MNVRDYLSEGTLLDGRTAIFRAIREEDKQTLSQEFGRLKQKDVYQRFFYVKKGLSTDELTFLTEVDFVRHVALVAGVVVNGAVQPAGVGRFVILDEDPATADIAFTVVEEFQGLGVATALLKSLTIIARELGYREFSADVLPENLPMLEVFAHSGLQMRTSTSKGVSNIRLSL